ncbi:hypothetical protein MWU49_06905 [Alcanivorax sp. S6407]|uniref:hypothetical protein n=1 Tax=Alcanivorax sp. S6407 TaxID=2926424 RepID=UPI001FF1AF1F|nr:hypothetical protein [Alcanivorax sp. S6407]MCK0153423.1 hypothetical protein [Alcanivorax sp. S6407]
MNSDNEKALMQSLRQPAEAGDALLSSPLFTGFASEDEILAAWQEGALNAEQEGALKSALASSNALRQQWLALSAAVPKASHGAVWHSFFRWHWATIGMTASVALVGVLLFRQGQLPVMPEQSAAMHSPMEEQAEMSDDSQSDELPQRELLERQRREPEAKKARDLPSRSESGMAASSSYLADGVAGGAEFDSAMAESAPVMSERAMVQAKPRPAPLAPAPSSLPSAAQLAPEPVAEDVPWQDYLAVYQGDPAATSDTQMAALAEAVLAVEASDCDPADVALLQQAFQTVNTRYPATFAPLAPASQDGWCELGPLLEQEAESSAR